VTVDFDTRAVLAAVDRVAEGATVMSEERVYGALVDAFAAEDLLSARVAARVARVFVESVPLADVGLASEGIARELGVSITTLETTREHVARLAAGSSLLAERLLSEAA
jgi:hypothetical protein